MFIRWIVFLAVMLVGGLAWAEEAAALSVGGVGIFDVMWGAGAVVVVNVVVLFARSLPKLDKIFAPDPSTSASRSWSRLLALVVGICTGLVGLAEIIPVDASIWGAVWIGRVSSGIVVAGIAVFGRDAVVKGVWNKRAPKKEKP